MRRETDEYIAACRDFSRKSYVEISFGLFSKVANDNLEDIEGTYKDFGNVNTNSFKVSDRNYVSCEPGRVNINDNYFFINSSNPVYNVNQDISYWSSEMSNENGNFIANPFIEYRFDKLTLFINVTLYFQEVCESFNVEYYNNNEIIAFDYVRNNNLLKYRTNLDKSELFYDRIRITFIKTAMPYRYVKYNNIDFGIIETFDKNEILSIDINEEFDLFSDELSSNTFTANVRDTGEYNVFNETGKLQHLQERQEMTVYHYLKINNGYVRKNLGTYLLKDFSNDNMQITFNCYDDIYFMNKKYLGSKFYVNENITVILKDLFDYFNYTKYDYTAIENSNIILSGYVPPMQMREALRVIVEAGKCCVFKTSDGITKIVSYDDMVSTPVLELTDEEVFNDKPSKSLYQNVIEITENVYSNTENKEIYKNKLKQGIYTVAFEDYPAVNITISNAVLLETYATGAKIRVDVNNSDVIISGDVYARNEINHIVGLESEEDIDDYAVQSVNNPLITSQYEEIANWKLSKGSITKNIQIMMMPFLQLGDVVSYINRYGKTINMRINNINFTNSIKMYLKGD